MNDESLQQTAEIVKAFLSHNAVASSDLPKVIQSVHRALTGAADPGGQPAESAYPTKPAVPIRQSITPDHLICLEDGKKFKSLKRHLRAEHDLDPAAYRARWGLKPDYPMVASNYTESRSSIAKAMGLGRGVRTTQPEPEVASTQAAPKRARRRTATMTKDK